MIKSWYDRFFAQPHQPFFVNGFIQVILFMALLFLIYSNRLNIEVSTNIYHIYSFVFIIFVQFFVGFLFVVFPRFLIQAEVLQKVYTQQFFIYFLGTLIFLISIIFSSKFYIIGAIIVLIAQILSFNTLFGIYKKSITKDKYDTRWILIGFASGIVSNMTFLISLLDFKQNIILQQFSIYTGFYLFLFVIFFTISQRMIPFFTSMKVSNYKINKSKRLIEKLYFLLFLKVIFLVIANPKLYFISDVPLFLFFVFELYKWRLPLFRTPAIIWILYISLYWIPIGFFISSFESISALFGVVTIFEKASIHTFAIGYFITALVGFATRVILGHSGQTPYASKFAITIFILIQLVVMIRLFASFSLNSDFDYIYFINLSSIFLVIILLVWSFKYLAILIKGFKPNS